MNEVICLSEKVTRETIKNINKFFLWWDMWWIYLKKIWRNNFLPLLFATDISPCLRWIFDHERQMYFSGANIFEKSFNLCYRAEMYFPARPRCLNYNIWVMKIGRTVLTITIRSMPANANYDVNTRAETSMSCRWELFDEISDLHYTSGWKMRILIDGGHYWKWCRKCYFMHEKHWFIWNNCERYINNV